jgi:hypothetical protein
MIALFAMGAVVHSAGASGMSLKMAMADVGGAGMESCQGCGTDADSEMSGWSCDIVCSVSFAACFGQVDTFSSRLMEQATLHLVEHLTGWAGLPEPYPPRAFI